MRVYLNSITGFADAFTSLRMSKRSWTRGMEMGYRTLEDNVLDRNGFIKNGADPCDVREFSKQLDGVCKWGKRHITLLRFIDVSVTVEGLHRAGQDDFDSHAMRLGNRIVRSSTRLATFEDGEMSDYYKDKIITSDQMAKILGISMPDLVEHQGKWYAKCVNGYVHVNDKDNKDVLRGLYMMSIPSNFIFKCNITELAHIIKERDKMSSANPEVQEMIELLLEQLESAHPQFNRTLFYDIRN